MAASVSMVADASVKSGLMSSIMEDLSDLALDSIFSILCVIASLVLREIGMHLPQVLLLGIEYGIA